MRCGAVVRSAAAFRSLVGHRFVRGLVIVPKLAPVLLVLTGTTERPSALPHRLCGMTAGNVCAVGNLRRSLLWLCSVGAAGARQRQRCRGGACGSEERQRQSPLGLEANVPVAHPRPPGQLHCRVTGLTIAATGASSSYNRRFHRCFAVKPPSARMAAKVRQISTRVWPALLSCGCRMNRRKK